MEGGKSFSRSKRDKTVIPTRLSPGGDQSGGWEFATLSFPCRHLAPSRLPASQRYSPRQAELRPHSRADQPLAVGWISSEASKLACDGRLQRPLANQVKTRLRFADPRLYQLAPGRPPLLAVRWPNATGLTSYLSGCVSLTSQRCGFHIADVRKMKSPCHGSLPSRSACSLCPAFRRLSFGRFG